MDDVVFSAIVVIVAALIGGALVLLATYIQNKSHKNMDERKIQWDNVMYYLEKYYINKEKRIMRIENNKKINEELVGFAFANIYSISVIINSLKLKKWEKKILRHFFIDIETELGCGYEPWMLKYIHGEKSYLFSPEFKKAYFKVTDKEVPKFE